jgi:hypothetical protein
MERGPEWEWVRTTFSYGAQLSFGVYLAHPMVLDLVLAVLRRAGLLRPSVWVSLTALALTVLVTVVICAALHRTRLSLPLMGRARLASAGSMTAPVDRSVTAWRQWLPRLRARLVTVPSGVLAASVLGVLVIGGDQTPPSEISRPSWEQTVEASSPLPATEDGCSDVVTATASSAGTGSTDAATVTTATAGPTASTGTSDTVTASTTSATTPCANGTLGQ